MQFSDIIAQEEVKNDLIKSVAGNRLSHAQLFLGPEGSGNLALAVAFAQFINCEDPGQTDSCGRCNSCVKAAKLIHPDIHFSYPFVTNKTAGKTKSTDYIQDWRDAVLENPYCNLHDWLLRLNAENKQGNIPVSECRNIIRKLTLKVFEAKYKILIMWMVEHLGAAGNVMLKMIEEPPDDTVILLVANNQDLILSTILSRTQLVKVKRLSDSAIIDALSGGGIDRSEAERIAFIADGNYNEAIRIASKGKDDNDQLLAVWLTSCIRNRSVDLNEFIEDFAKIGRENQKHFFKYTLRFFRECMMYNFPELDQVKLNDHEMELAKELLDILKLDQFEALIKFCNEASYHIERNANPKILMLDLSIKVSGLFKNSLNVPALK